MARAIVSTKEEFKEAVKAKVDEIALTGDALKYYKAVKKLKASAKWGLPLLIGSILLIPVTGGGSAALGALGAGTFGRTAVATAAATTAATEVGLPLVALYTFLAFFGITLLVALFSNYQEIHITGMGMGLKLKK